MRRETFDVVHTHSSKAGFLGRVAARVVGVPLVVHTPHVFPFQMQVAAPIRFLYLQLERLAARFAHRLICVCPSQRAVAEKVIAPDRIVVIENGISRQTSETGYHPRPNVERGVPAPFLDHPTHPSPSWDTGEDALATLRDTRKHSPALGIPPNHLIAGMIGRFARQKGHAYFIEAARCVAERQPTVHFLFVGDGELRRRIERNIVSAGLRDRFTVMGEHEDVPSLLPAFDLVVLPSLWEGLPYALLEAMAAGKAIVASRVGGMADVIEDGVNGLLVPPGDPSALAGAMLKVLENGELRSNMGERAAETLRHRYGADGMMGRLEQVYEGTL
jgi:glycosyltransferase involved in cell wall biosynthesis